MKSSRPSATSKHTTDWHGRELCSLQPFATRPPNRLVRGAIRKPTQSKKKSRETNDNQTRNDKICFRFFLLVTNTRNPEQTRKKRNWEGKKHCCQKQRKKKCSTHTVCLDMVEDDEEEKERRGDMSFLCTACVAWRYELFTMQINAQQKKNKKRATNTFSFYPVHRYITMYTPLLPLSAPHSCKSIALPPCEINVGEGVVKT